MSPLRNHNHSSRSSRVYFRTIGAMVLVSAIAFFVLCVLYFHIQYSQILKTKANSLSFMAEEAVSAYVASTDNKTPSGQQDIKEDPYLKILTLAREHIVAWIVDGDGCILYHSTLPPEVLGQLAVIEDETDHLPDVIYRIPEYYTIKLLNPAFPGYGYQNSSMAGLFSDMKNVWITVSHQIPGTDQYLLLHEPVNVEAGAFSMMTADLGIPVLISFALSLLLFSFVTRSIVHPIHLLSEAAMKIVEGDLSTRIKVPEEDNHFPSRFFVADEMADMIRTVNHMIERLELQDNERRVFISSIAHDLRTPLTSIKGFISAIQDGTIPPEKVDHYLGIVEHEVERLQTLTHTMTDVSSIGEKEGFQMNSFDIKESIFATLNGMETQLNQKNLDVQLESDYGNDEPVLVNADKKAIDRVIYNLVNNAIKFTPENGAIGISLRKSAKTGQVFVIIEDSGPGIPKEKRDRVFDSFYKLDPSRTREGSGLGLYICKEIMHAHNQRIFVTESEVLGGAKITFTLSDIPPYDGGK